MTKYIWLSALILITILASCQRQPISTTGGNLSFSVDTLLFDTVFSSTKSSTHIVKIFNNDNKRVKVIVGLGAGTNSPYTLNVDGNIGKQGQEIEIAGEDSAFVFATLLVEPNNDSIPFVVEDRLTARVNGIDFKIPIIGYAQNAYYIRDSVLTTSTLLTDKPYVIINNALVGENETLTIPAGARIYMHADSRLFVQGTLKIQGTATDSVIFQGDRIDRRIYVGDFADVPGEWGGIYFLQESKDNIIDHAILKNGGLSTMIGGQAVLGAMIQLDGGTSGSTAPKLRITNSQVLNSKNYGIIAFASSLYAENCLVAECEQENLALLQGGDYELNDCTIATFGRLRYLQRQSGHIAVVVQNFYAVDQNTFVGSNLNSVFRNCIISGNAQNEFIANKRSDWTASLNLDHCLINYKDPLPDWLSVSNVIKSNTSQFQDLDKGNYHLAADNPAIFAGISAGTISTDLDGVFRTINPSIGAYEFVP